MKLAEADGMVTAVLKTDATDQPGPSIGSRKQITSKVHLDKNLLPTGNYNVCFKTFGNAC